MDKSALVLGARLEMAIHIAAARPPCHGYPIIHPPSTKEFSVQWSASSYVKVIKSIAVKDVKGSMMLKKIL